jgi:hypothetical protein
MRQSSATEPAILIGISSVAQHRFSRLEACRAQRDKRCEIRDW